MKVVLISTMPPIDENKRIGEEVNALGDEFIYTDLRDFTLEIIKGEVKVKGVTDIDADVVIVRGILQSIKVISALVRQLRSRGVKVFDNNFLEHEYSINKVTDLTKLAYKNIPVPDTYNANNFEAFYDLAKKAKFPAIVKSTKMGKGASVYKVDNNDELTELITEFEESEKKAKNYIIQEYIPYEYDIRALTIGTEVFAMRRIPAKGEFRANFSLGGDVELIELDNEAKILAIKALKAIDMTVGGVDILITKDNKRYILEVNHNAGFLGMEKATGKNIGKIFVEHAISNSF